jgi:hypothetical protein
VQLEIRMCGTAALRWLDRRLALFKLGEFPPRPLSDSFSDARGLFRGKERYEDAGRHRSDATHATLALGAGITERECFFYAETLRQRIQEASVEGIPLSKIGQAAGLSRSGFTS